MSSLEHRAKIECYVALAVRDGAQVLCGGARPQGLAPPFDQGAFYEPTLLAGLAPEHACSREEIFGPVATVHRFNTESELIGYVNNTSYGLAGSLWTNDLSRAHRVARQWDVGMAWINTWLHRDLRVPFGQFQATAATRGWAACCWPLGLAPMHSIERNAHEACTHSVIDLCLFVCLYALVCRRHQGIRCGHRRWPPLA